MTLVLPSAFDLYPNWVEETDPDWRLARGDERLNHSCRGSRNCSRIVVACLLRRNGRGSKTRWFYCDRHLYGRRIMDGVLMRPRRPIDADPSSVAGTDTA